MQELCALEREGMVSCNLDALVLIAELGSPSLIAMFFFIFNISHLSYEGVLFALLGSIFAFQI